MASTLPLTFLRPMALPRASTMHKYFGAATRMSQIQVQAPTLRKASTSTSPLSTPTTPSPSSTTSPISAEAGEAASSSTTPTPAKTHPIKPYLIVRTPSNKLPIYHLSKRGGNKKLTRLRKIEGDVNMLKSDLAVELGMLGDKDVVVNQLTRQVIVKGHKKSQIEKFFINLQQ